MLKRKSNNIRRRTIDLGEVLGMLETTCGVLEDMVHHHYCDEPHEMCPLECGCVDQDDLDLETSALWSVARLLKSTAYAILNYYDYNGATETTLNGVLSKYYNRNYTFRTIIEQVSILIEVLVRHYSKRAITLHAKLTLDKVETLLRALEHLKIKVNNKQEE